MFYESSIALDITLTNLCTVHGRDGHGSGRPAGRVGSKFLKCVILFFIREVKYFYPLLRKLNRPIVNNSESK